MDPEGIDLIGARQGSESEAEAAMMRRAKRVSARIHEEGRSAAAAQNVGWLKELRSETNADIAFMVTLIKSQSL